MVAAASRETIARDDAAAERARRPRTLGGVVAALAEWRGDEAGLLAALASLQAQLCDATSAAIVRDGRVVAGDAAGWSAEATALAAEAIGRGDVAESVVQGRPLVAAPIDDRTAGIALLSNDDPAVRMLAAERLTLTATLPGRWSAARGEAEARRDAGRLRGALDLAAAAAEREDDRAATLAFCNAVARQLDARRASLGLVRPDGTVDVAAVSDAADLRRTAVVASLAQAMAECAEQDREVLYPAPDGEDVVTRAAQQHAREHGGGRVASLPLRWGGRVGAVLSVERDANLSPDDAARLRLACDLLAPRLDAESRARRWLSPRAAGLARRVAAAVVGPGHTAAKLACVATVGAGVLPLVVTGTDRSIGTFHAESADRREVVAPASADLAECRVRSGDAIAAGDVLATLDTTDLELELAAVRAEARAERAKANAARSRTDPAAAELADLAAVALEARADLLERRVAEAVVRSPLDGLVLAGDLRGRVGGHVERGEPLLTIGPAAASSAVVWVHEADAASVRVGQPVSLRTAARPGVAIGGGVDRVSPVVEERPEGRFVRVWARFDAEVRHGEEGVAAVEVGRASLAELWARPFARWLGRTFGDRP